MAQYNVYRYVRCLFPQNEQHFSLEAGYTPTFDSGSIGLDDMNLPRVTCAYVDAP